MIEYNKRQVIFIQVLKDEVRIRILEEGEKEFLEKGFLGASLRKISKSAGTTIGNFYNYFESKEDLFKELVEKEYVSFISFLDNHDSLEIPGKLIEINDIKQLREVLSMVLQLIMPNLSDSFVLLMESSKGTSFENIKEEFVGLLKDHIVEHMIEAGLEEIDYELASHVAKQFLNGIILVLKNHRDEDIRKRLLTEHIVFYIFGVMGIMGESDYFFDSKKNE